MKPFLEKLRPSPEASFAMLDRRLDEAIPFQWHHHPEFELTLTLNSRGQRFIGDHIGRYDDGDLVLIGPNLPHTWSSTDKIDKALPHSALVLWFLPAWADLLSKAFAEFRNVGQMLGRAGRALRFSQEASQTVRPRIEALFARPADERLVALVEILAILARDRSAEPLASPGLGSHMDETSDRTRIDRVLEHIHATYASRLTLAELADIAALSPSGLHRMFRRHTRMSMTDYVARLRVGQACALLSGTEKSIAHIAEAVGYASLANFNRQFKAQSALTPRQYRARFRALDGPDSR
jgi:AraC-like DNA-binding protein